MFSHFKAPIKAPNCLIFYGNCGEKMTKLPDEWVAIAILRLNAIGVIVFLTVFLTDENFSA
jgi:hypothetical protein